MSQARFVALDDAGPDDAVVVIDVLRAFTTEAWALHCGASRVLAVAAAERAFALRDADIDDVVLAGEDGGRPMDGFDTGNSPSAIAEMDLTGRTFVHRTSAGTQGLVRCQDSPLLLAASFVTAAATARELRASGAARVTYVITGASLGRNGDEDLACAELIAARVAGDAPDPRPFLDRVPLSDAGRKFGSEPWLPSVDVDLSCEVDRFDFALVARSIDELEAIEVTAR